MTTFEATSALSNGDAAFRKLDMELKEPVPKFDAAKHLAFETPTEYITLDELLLSNEKAISPIAVTAPFPLFSPEGVKQLRASAFDRSVVSKYAKVNKPGCYKMRGYSPDAPFVDQTWRSKAVLDACSHAAGVELEVVFDYEIGHLNVQIEELVDRMDEINEILPPGVPIRQPRKLSEEEEKSVHLSLKDMAAVGAWHTDSYPWVCVVMLSDTTGMQGGETGLKKGDGSILKVRGPSAGWAVMMQGGCIEHVALQGFGSGERITMVTSFRPKDPLARDGSTLNTVKRSSNLDELFIQWSTYRMDLIAKRAQAQKEKMEKERKTMTHEQTRSSMEKWVTEQIEYLKFTVSEMVE